jgi:hypothetical protein
VLNNIGQYIFETYVLLPQDAQSVTFVPSTEPQQLRWKELQAQQQQQ